MHVFGGYVGAALAALVLYFLVPSRAVSELIWQAFIWGAVIAIGLGARVHRPDRSGPWWVTMVGLGLLALGGTVNLPWWPHDSLELRRVVGDLLTLIGYPLIGVGTAWFARAQSGGRDTGPVLDSLIVMIALTTVLWEGVFALYGMGTMTSSSRIALLAISASASWVAAMSTRLILAGGYRATSGWLLFSSSVAGMAGAVAFLLTGGQGRLITGGATDALWGVAVLLVAAAAAHPSMTTLTRPAPGIEVANLAARVLLPAFALATPPAALLLRQVTTGQSATVAAGASVVVAAIVVLRFADLVRARERSRHESSRRAVRQSALARLGERGLSGTGLSELIEAAASVLRSELGLGDLQLEVVEQPPAQPSDGPGTGPGRTAPVAGTPSTAHHMELPGSRGLVRLRTANEVVLADDTAEFVSSVGHVLAAAVQRHHDEEELRYRSLHDPLTGLANRTLLDDRIRQSLGRRRGPGRGTAVAFIDLDGFKAVNDTYGHGIGDELLRAAARRLAACVRDADTVARFAGDEFVVVLDDVDDVTASELAERLLAGLRGPVAVGDLVLGVSASIGLALECDATEDPDALLRRADAAMYRSKQQGRGRLMVAAPHVAPSG